MKSSAEHTEAAARWAHTVPSVGLNFLIWAGSALLAVSAEGVLSPDQQAMLVRPRSASLDDVPWTAADAARDEAIRGRLLAGGR